MLLFGCENGERRRNTCYHCRASRSEMIQPSDRRPPLTVTPLRPSGTLVSLTLVSRPCVTALCRGSCVASWRRAGMAGPRRMTHTDPIGFGLRSRAAVRLPVLDLSFELLYERRIRFCDSSQHLSFLLDASTGHLTDRDPNIKPKKSSCGAIKSKRGVEPRAPLVFATGTRDRSPGRRRVSA